MLELLRCAEDPEGIVASEDPLKVIDRLDTQLRLPANHQQKLAMKRGH